MTSVTSIPIAPLELRAWVGPTDPVEFDNPSGTPIFAHFGNLGWRARAAR